ncbi:MAG: CopD family protein [Gammaproteobacteria bacterium]|nr:CopD family protein [Gammaproteobacteria bacterium]MCP5423546.1 CopD family protein [Gammaproteobacteria bacterium]
MFFAYFCLRPASGQVLEPPQRLPLWVATFRLFLRYAAISVIVLIGSGLGMLLPVGISAAPHGWLVMMVIGLTMASLFAYLYGILYPELVHNTLASSWPAAAKVLNGIRRLVALNLALSILVIVSAVTAR